MSMAPGDGAILVDAQGVQLYDGGNTTVEDVPLGTIGEYTVYSDVFVVNRKEKHDGFTVVRPEEYDIDERHVKKNRESQRKEHHCGGKNASRLGIC
jgi:hypothetical protein